jgi:hypothetical protein
MVAHFALLLGAIAAIAGGDETLQAEVEAMLARLEERGWHLQAAVRRIWAGDRDDTALTAGLDEHDSALVRRILNLIAGR